MLSAPTILNKINGVLISFSLQNVQLGNRYGSNKIIVIPDTSFRPRCNMDNDTLAGVKFLHAAGTLCGSYPASNRITNAVFIVTMPTKSLYSIARVAAFSAGEVLRALVCPV